MGPVEPSSLQQLLRVRENHRQRGNSSLCHQQALMVLCNQCLNSRGISWNHVTFQNTGTLIQAALGLFKRMLFYGLELMKLVLYESKGCFLLISCLSFSLTCSCHHIFEQDDWQCIEVLMQRALISVSLRCNACWHFCFGKSKKSSKFGWLA